MAPKQSRGAEETASQTKARGSTPDFAVAAQPGGRTLWWLPRPRWHTLMLALLVAFAVAGAIVVLNSPLMEIRSVEVRGAERVSADAVAQLVGLRGENILLANLGEARQRVIGQPLVRDASIHRVWPNGLVVEIEERVPWARWQVEEQFWAVDAEGVVLEGVEIPEGGPVVRQVSAQPAIRAGAVVDLSAVALIREMDEVGPPRGGPEILAYEWSQRSGLTVVTKHGRVTFGDTDGFAFKYGVWQELELEAQSRGEPLLAADLRFGTRPRVEIGFGLGRATRIVDP